MSLHQKWYEEDDAVPPTALARLRRVQSLAATPPKLAHPVLPLLLRWLEKLTKPTV